MRHEKHFSKDHYSFWHRKYEGIAMVDIDSVEVCPRCYEPLAMIETAYYRGHFNKATTLTREIAKRCNVPAYMVFYYEIETPARPPQERAKHPQILADGERYDIDLMFVWRNLFEYPVVYKETNQDVWLNELNMLHERHSKDCKRCQK